MSPVQNTNQSSSSPPSQHKAPSSSLLSILHRSLSNPILVQNSQLSSQSPCPVQKHISQFSSQSSFRSPMLSAQFPVPPEQSIRTCSQSSSKTKLPAQLSFQFKAWLPGPSFRIMLSVVLPVHSSKCFTPSTISAPSPMQTNLSAQCPVQFQNNAANSSPWNPLHGQPLVQFPEQNSQLSHQVKT